MRTFCTLLAVLPTFVEAATYQTQCIAPLLNGQSHTITPLLASNAPPGLCTSFTLLGDMCAERMISTTPKVLECVEYIEQSGSGSTAPITATPSHALGQTFYGGITIDGVMVENWTQTTSLNVRVKALHPSVQPLHCASTRVQFTISTKSNHLQPPYVVTTNIAIPSSDIVLGQAVLHLDDNISVGGRDRDVKIGAFTTSGTRARTTVVRTTPPPIFGTIKIDGATLAEKQIVLDGPTTTVTYTPNTNMARTIHESILMTTSCL